LLINNPVLPLTGANPWTIALWVKTTTAGGVYAYQGSGGWVSGKHDFLSEPGQRHWLRHQSRGSWLGARLGDRNGRHQCGNWHFLVMTCNGNSKTMYLDGNVDAIVSSWAAVLA